MESGASRAAGRCIAIYNIPARKPDTHGIRRFARPDSGNIPVDSPVCTPYCSVPSRQPYLTLLRPAMIFQEKIYMNSMRKFLCVLTAVVMVAFALPATALDKMFSISTPTTTILPAGATAASAVVRFKNESTGNSTIKSLTLTVSPDVGIVSASGSSGNATISGQTVIFTGITGVKPGGTFDVNLTLSVGVAAACGQDLWTGHAYAGNNVGVTAFTAAPGADVVTVYVGCDASIACGSPTFTKPAGGAAGPDDPGWAEGFRGLYNADGTTNGTGCSAVIYGLTNNIDLASKLVILKYTGGNQPDAFFSYDLTWEPTSKPPNTPYSVVNSAWQLLPDQSGPAYVPTLFCLSANPPAPYGTLAADLAATGPTATSMTVNLATGAILPNGNFLVRIGAEPILVTKVSGNIWTLVRNPGGAVLSPAAFHGTGAIVVSSPFPFVPNNAIFTSPGYTAGTQAHVCAADEESDSLGNGQNQYFTTIFSTGGDPWVNGP